MLSIKFGIMRISLSANMHTTAQAARKPLADLSGWQRECSILQLIVIIQCVSESATSHPWCNSSWGNGSQKSVTNKPNWSLPATIAQKKPELGSDLSARNVLGLEYNYQSSVWTLQISDCQQNTITINWFPMYYRKLCKSQSFGNHSGDVMKTNKPWVLYWTQTSVLCKGAEKQASMSAIFLWSSIL